MGIILLPVCTSNCNLWYFYSALAKLALQALYMVWQIRPFICPSVSLSVCHLRYCVKTREHRGMRSYHPMSWVFWCQEWLWGKTLSRYNLSAMTLTLPCENSRMVPIFWQDDPVPIKFGPKGTHPQQEGCTFHTQSAVQSALADILV